MTSRVIEYVKNGWPSKIEEQFKPYYDIIDEVVDYV